MTNKPFSFNPQIHYMLHDSAAWLAQQDWFVLSDGQKEPFDFLILEPDMRQMLSPDPGHLLTGDKTLCLDISNFDIDELSKLEEYIKKHVIHCKVVTGDTGQILLQVPFREGIRNLARLITEHTQGLLGRAAWTQSTDDCGIPEKRLETSALAPSLIERYVHALETLDIPYTLTHGECPDDIAITVQGAQHVKILDLYHHNVAQAAVRSRSYSVEGISTENHGFYDPYNDTAVFVSSLTGDVVTVHPDGSTHIKAFNTSTEGMVYWGQKLDRMAKALNELPPMIEGGITLSPSYQEFAESAGDFVKILKVSGTTGNVINKLKGVFKGAVKNAGRIGFALETYDIAMCTENIEIYFEAGLISQEARDDYNELLLKYLGVGTANISFIADKYLISEFEEWVDKHNVPPYYVESLNPGTLSEAVLDLIGLDSNDTPNTQTPAKAAILQNKAGMTTEVCPDDTPDPCAPETSFSCKQ